MEEKIKNEFDEAFRTYASAQKRIKGTGSLTRMKNQLEGIAYLMLRIGIIKREEAENILECINMRSGEARRWTLNSYEKKAD